VQGCDRLFFLDRGRIAAHGTFAEVLVESAEFRAMVEQARLRPAQAIDAVA
jgi:ABC-type multidrug transport system fused ATPase/permease subunit